MRFCPTWSKLPLEERIVLATSLIIAFCAVAFFSFWADVGGVTAMIKFAGLGSLVLAIGVTGNAAYRLFHDHMGQRSINTQLVGWALRHKIVVGVWLLCTLLSLSLFPMGNRVLMDEIVVLGTSRAIHEEREPVTPMLLTGQNGVHKLTAAYIDKRPYLYATIVSVFHDLLGYSPKNAFYANMLLGALTLALLGAVGAKIGGAQEAGALAMVALTSVPLFCEHVTGGGIDVLNLYSILLVLLFAILHVERPSMWSARAMLGAGVLLAYSRYESLLFILLPVAIVGIVFTREKRLFLGLPALLLWPAMVPLFGLHYLTFSKSSDSFQLVEQGNSEAFSLDYIPDNIAHALAFFLDDQHLLTNSAVVFAIGLFAFLLLVVATAGRWRRLSVSGIGAGFWLVGIIILLSFALLMAYSWGKLDQSIASRLSLPLYLLFSLSIAAVCREIKNARRYTFILGFILAGSVYWSCFPLAAKQYGSKLYPSGQTLALLNEFNDKQADRRFAVLNGITNYWVTRDVFVVAPMVVGKTPEFVANMLRSGEFRRVYLIQILLKNKKTGAYIVQRSDVLPVALDTELISEEAATNERKVRISLVKESSISILDALVKVSKEEESKAEPVQSSASEDVRSASR